MSPEQAQLNNLDVDTRSDIYSLGVLLYELLTGTTPLEKQRFKQAAWDEIKRIIREEDPPQPSLRLSTVDTLPSLAAGRQTEPARLTKLVRGELDWIVMKALEKDRSRRYETANGFATDIQRHLAGEPVLAAPPTARYRLQKFARKHRAALTTAATIMLLLVTGVALSAWQAVRATRAEQKALLAQRAEEKRAEGERRAKLEAQAKRAEAEQQKARAEAGEKLASERFLQIEAEKQKTEEEKQIAQAVLNFLQHKLLRQADMRSQADALLESGGVEAVAETDANPTVRELLDRAAKELTAERIDANFPNQPLVQAAILYTVGSTYSTLRESDKALDFLERSLALQRQALGSQHPGTLAHMVLVAGEHLNRGNYDLAIQLFQEVLDLWKTKLGSDHPGTITSMGNLAAALTTAKKLDLGIPLLETTLELGKAKLGPNHAVVLNATYNLGRTYSLNGKHDLGIKHVQESLAIRKATLGPVHPDTLRSMNGLAGAYAKAGKLELALPLSEEVVKLYQATHDRDHPMTLAAMTNLADTYWRANQLELSAALHEETLRIRKAKFGAEDAGTLYSLDRLARAYSLAKKFDQALPLYEEALQLIRAKHGPEHADTLAAMTNLANALRAAGQFDRWIPLCEELIKLQTTTLGPGHPDTLTTKARLGEHFREPGGYYSIPMLEEVWEVRKRILPEGDATRINTQNLLGQVLFFAGRYAEAETHLLTSYRDLLGSKDASPSQSLAYARRLVYLYAEWDKPAELAHWRAEMNKIAGSESPLSGAGYTILLQRSRFRAAEVVLREHLAFSETNQPDAWETFHVQFSLGCALLGQKKFADAEPLLLTGYAGMKRRDSKMPQDTRFRVTETLVWLTQFYESQGMKDEAAKWAHDAGKPSIALYEDMVKALKATHGAEHPETIAMMAELAGSSREAFDYDRSLSLFEELWKIRQQILPQGHKTRIDTQNHLGLSLLMAGRFAEAESHLLASYRDGQGVTGFPRDWTLVYAVRLITLYAEWDKPDEVAHWQAELKQLSGPKESYLYGTGSWMLQAARFRAAEALLRDGLELREQTSTNDWITFHTKYLLGCALLAQKKHADAEPLLLSAYEGLKQRQAEAPPDHDFRLSEAAAPLVELYVALDDKDQAARWSRELESQKRLEEKQPQ
jgi:hypothetical protein